jgi:L-cystine uptake protein TcyP (sodium:dicarboxylate symporter family)
MARTALNISGSMLSGVLTAKKNGSLNAEQYNADVAATVTKEAAV